MGYLLHLLVALLGQGLAETGWTTGWDAPWFVLLALPVPHLLGWIGHALFLRGKFRASAFAVRSLGIAAPVLHVLAVCAFGWLDALHRWFGDGVSLAGWPRAGLLVALVRQSRTRFPGTRIGRKIDRRFSISARSFGRLHA